MCPEFAKSRKKDPCSREKKNLCQKSYPRGEKRRGEKGKRKEHDRRRVGRGPGWTSLNLALEEEEEEEEEEEDRLV